MDGETNGGQAGAEGQAQEQDAAEQKAQQAQQPQAPQQQVSGSPNWEKQIAERDERIAELEGQVAEAAKSAESAEQLRAEIAELKAQGESDRVDFTLKLAGARNVKAARALLGEHDGDVEALREAEPWLFSAAGAAGAGTSGEAGAAGDTASGAGATGLPNAGAATDEGRTLRHWREIAGLSGDESDKRD